MPSPPKNSVPKTFYTIPAGVPFADALAQGLLAEAGGDPAVLATYRIFLPTRRACRTLRDTFLRLGQGKALLLPQMQPLGDVDDDELALSDSESGAGEIALNLPPAMPKVRRRLLLAQLVMKLPAYEGAPDKALAVAEELGRLMDRIHTENLLLDGLKNLVSADYAAHWQITLDFLGILAQAWPVILESYGMIDAADRRNRLMQAMAQHLRGTPPQTPVVAAGSTGSIPATGELLSVIAGLPQGCVVLPGLDRDIDEQSWDALEDTHPQATLKELLTRAGVARDAVKDWPHNLPQDIELAAQRRWLAREAMRPAATAGAWTNLNVTTSNREKLVESLIGVRRFECAAPQEEASLIALLLRETLETPGKRAALVTPDRALARRVSAACKRWGLTLDDSAGLPLGDSSVGGFLRLCAAACIDGLRPSALLAALRHPLCTALPDTQKFETKLLRGPAPASGIDGLRARLVEDENTDQQIAKFIDKLDALFTPFLSLCAQKSADFTALMETHLALAENLAGDPDNLWAGDDGNAAALFFMNLREHAALMPQLAPRDYLAVLEQMMKGESVRTPTGAHPRLTILGQLEARLIQADLVILGGLNEGTWPAAPAADPWMSRPMRKAYGLPSPERGTGLAAHDFVQGFCAPQVVLTRSRRAGGTPTVPARWLARLDTVLTALGIAPSSLSHGPHLHFAREMDKADAAKPFTRPAPTPPADARPTSLYVTAIEKLMRDPYSIYARYILRLKKLDALEEEADAAKRGDIMHKALDIFIRKHPETLPENALDLLLEEGKAQFGAMLSEPRLWAFWWPRFERLAAWFIDHERGWRDIARPHITEASGEAIITHDRGIFTLKAKTDRVDLLNTGDAAIIDYKTGSTPKTKDVKDGFSPQLPLEAVIAQQGGFEKLGAKKTGYLGFWRMAGGQEAGKEINIAAGDDVMALAAQASEGLRHLAAVFADPATPYYSLPRPDKAPPAAWQDYAHLARVQEWVALGETEGEAA